MRELRFLLESVWKIALRSELMILVDDLFTPSNSPHRELFQEVKYAWEALPKMEAYLKNRIEAQILGSVHEGAYIVNPEWVFIDEGTIVEPGALIEGPCWIGKSCAIRHGAYLRGNVILEDGCVVGHVSEVKNSLLLKGAKAAHFAYVGDSILGRDVNLGAGTKLANLRFDRKEIVIKIGKERIHTHLKKLGALMGDGSQTGCNAVINPGTIFLKGALCYPCETVSGVKK